MTSVKKTIGWRLHDFQSSTLSVWPKGGQRGKKRGGPMQWQSRHPVMLSIAYMKGFFSVDDGIAH